MFVRVPQKPHVQTSRNCLYVLSEVVARSFSDDSGYTLCISGFVDNVMFSNNRPIWRVALAISTGANSHISYVFARLRQLVSYTMTAMLRNEERWR